MVATTTISTAPEIVVVSNKEVVSNLNSVADIDGKTAVPTTTTTTTTTAPEITLKEEAVLKEEYEKLAEVISEGESVDSDVADFETPFSHQDEEHYSAVNDNTNSVNSNREMVEGSRYYLNINASLNLDDVAATTTADANADVFDNTKF